MAETPTLLRCASCGEEVASPGFCPACSKGDDSLLTAGRTAHAAEQSAEAELAVSALWVRVCGALIYLIVGCLCLYASVSLFRRSDWVFGSMGIGLASIACIGIKQSLFPTDWREE